MFKTESFWFAKKHMETEDSLEPFLDFIYFFYC